MNQPGLKVSTPTDTTIVMTRTFNAPRRLVWQAMTDPATMRRWMFAPPGWTMTGCEVEARVGGKIRLTWKSAEADPAMVIHGVVTEAVPYERLVHTEIMEMAQCGVLGESLETLELSEKGGVTTMRMTLAYQSKQARDGALASGMEQGMEAGYASLDAWLAASV